MTEAKHSPIQITRAKLMQLPKEELVTELLGALRVVVSQHAATSLHAELVAALEESRRFMEYFAGETGGHFVGPGTPKSCLQQIDSTLQKARQK